MALVNRTEAESEKGEVIFIRVYFDLDSRDILPSVGSGYHL